MERRAGGEEREKGRKEATRRPEQQLRCRAVQSRESSIDVAKHMLRSRREKGDWVYARRAQYLLSSWHSHLSSKAATKKGVLVLYRAATTIRVARDHRGERWWWATIRAGAGGGRGGGGGGGGALESDGGGGGGGSTWLFPPPNPPSFDHIFPLLVSVTLKPFSAYVTKREREKFHVDLHALFLLSSRNLLSRNF